MGGPAAERVKADVQPAPVEVETDGLHQPHAQRPLGFHRERPLEGQDVRTALLALQHLAQEPRQEALQVAEQLVDVVGVAARLIGVQQRLIQRAAQRLRLGGRDLALEVQHFRQAGQQHREIAGGAGVAPDHFAAGNGAGVRFDQIARHRRRVEVGAAHLVQVGFLPVGKIGLVLGVGQQVGVVVVGQQLVAQDLQGRKLLGPAVGGTRRHQRLGVPLQNAERVVDRGKTGEAPFQRLIGGHPSLPEVINKVVVAVRAPLPWTRAASGTRSRSQ